MMAGLGIDFGPPEEQYQQPHHPHHQPTRQRPTLPQTSSAPAGPSPSRRPAPHTQPKRHTASNLHAHDHTGIPAPRRRVRIASGQPNVMGHGVGLLADSDAEERRTDFSSPETGYTSQSSFSGTVAGLHRNHGNGYLSSGSSSTSPDHSPSSETSPYHTYAAKLQRSRLLRKRASQPALSYSRPPSPTQVLTKSQSSYDLAATAAVAGASRPSHTMTQAVHPFSKKTTKNVEAERSSDVERMSPTRTEALASSPCRAEQKLSTTGLASPSKVIIAPLTPQQPTSPNEDGMVPDGFGGYRYPDDQGSTSTTALSGSDLDTPPLVQQAEVKERRDEPEDAMDHAPLPTSGSRRALPQVPVTAPLQLRSRAADRMRTEPGPAHDALVRSDPAERYHVPASRSRSFDGQSSSGLPDPHVSTHKCREVVHHTGYVSEGENTTQRYFNALRGSFAIGEVIPRESLYHSTENFAVERHPEQARTVFAPQDPVHQISDKHSYTAKQTFDVRPAQHSRSKSEVLVSSVDNFESAGSSRGAQICTIAEPSSQRPKDLKQPVDKYHRRAPSSPPILSVGQLPSPSRSSYDGSDIESPKVQRGATVSVEKGRQSKPRVDIDLVLENETIVEGGILRGRLQMSVGNDTDGAVLIAYPKVRVVGFEELLSDETRHIFYHHSTIVDGSSPLGSSQPFVLHGSPCLSSPGVEGREPLPCFASQPDGEGYSVGRPGSYTIPFSLEMPIGKGAKGSYRGKTALVRYIVIGSVKLKDHNGANRSIAHFYRHVDLLPYLNPAVVLASAPRPIQASAESEVFSGSSVQLTASLHRPTWVAGQRVYVNVGVHNETSKQIKSISFSLVRIVTTYQPRPDLAEASTDEVVGNDNYETTSCRRKVAEEILELGQKGGNGVVTTKGWWTGVKANSKLEFAHYLTLPSEALSISRSRHVEVSYEVKVSVGKSTTSEVSVNLPLRIVNFTSLDPPPLKGISCKSTGVSNLARGSVAGSPMSARNSLSADEAPMIEKVKAAEALRSPGHLRSARDQPDSSSGPPAHLLALSQRAAERNALRIPNNHLQAPNTDTSRSIQHQKSLDFIKHAIRSATARKNNSQQGTTGPATTTENLPMGLGIDIDAANHLSRMADEEQTPKSGTRPTFAPSSEASSVIASSRRRSSGARHYDNIDIPAPSFGFPFLQLPVVSVDDGEAFNSDEEEEVGNRTLGLNQDSVDEVDMVVQSTHRRDHNDRFDIDEEEDSFDPDASVETVRDCERREDFMGRESTPENPTSAEKSTTLSYPSIQVESPERAVVAQERRESVGRRVLHPTLATLPVNTATAVATLKKSSGNLRARVALPPTTEKRTSVVLIDTTSSPSQATKVLPSSRDCPSPTKSALKNKSSFTFATSEAPLRQSKTPRPISTSVKDAPRAKAAAAQFADAVGDDNKESRTNSPSRVKASAKQPTVMAVSVSVPKSSSRPSPRKSMAMSKDVSSSSDSDSAQEAVTPEMMAGELGGLVSQETSKELIGSTKQSQHLHKVDATLAHCTPPRVRNGPSVEPTFTARAATAATKVKTIRHSASVASISSLASSSSGNVERERIIHRVQSSQNIRGAAVIVPSVRNKIAQLENRQLALRQFVQHPGSLSAGHTPVKVGNLTNGGGGGGGCGIITTPTKTSIPTSATTSSNGGVAPNHLPSSESRIHLRNTRASHTNLHSSFAGLSIATSSTTSSSSSPSSLKSKRRLSKKASTLSLAPSEIDWTKEVEEEHSDEDEHSDEEEEEESWMKRKRSFDSLQSFKAPVFKISGNLIHPEVS